MLNLLATFIFILMIGCSSHPVPPQYNNHWQKEQDDKLVFCYQNAPTMELVDQCLFELGVFI